MDSAAKKETPASIPVPSAPSVIMAGSRREYLAADNLKIDITVKLSSATDVYQGFEVNDRAKFNVAIIYEDGAAGKRAKHFYDRVIRESSTNATSAWNFGASRCSPSRRLEIRPRKPPHRQTL